MYWLIGVCAVWGLLLSFALPEALGRGHYLEALATLAIGWGPGALLAWFLVNRTNGRNALRDGVLREAGIEPGRGFDHEEGGSGIALNPAAKTMSLWADGFAKRYDYAEVREWAAQFEKAGEIVALGGGLAAGMGAAGANSRARRAAQANTGLFVTVRDVEHPKWRVAMRDQSTQARWMEILRQEVNEGGVSASNAKGVAA